MFAEDTGRMLVTEDKRTLCGAHGHLAAHYAQQRHIWGVAFVRPNESLSRIAVTLVLIAELSHPDDWRDQEIWIPFD